MEIRATIKCDYCPGDRALLLTLLNGHKIYACAYCANELDEYVRDKLGKDVFDTLMLGKHVSIYGKLEEMQLRLLVKEVRELEMNVFEIQKEWILENVEPYADKRIENLLKDNNE